MTDAAAAPLKDHIAIVTGGSGAIGKAIAKALLSKGATVIITGRTEATLLVAQQELGDNNISTYVSDVSQEDQVVALFQHVKEQFGTCHILVNNAGTAIGGPTIDLSAQDMETVLKTNVVGPFVCAREFLKLQQKQSQENPNIRRRIINIGSISAISPRPHSAPYTTSKYAMLGLSHSLNLDAREYGVGVGVVHPGNVKSSLYSSKLIQERELTEGFCGADDVAACVATMAALPQSANVLELIVMPTKQPLIGRG